MSNYPPGTWYGDPSAPWNAPDGVDIDDCPNPYTTDEDCCNPSCDSCHCPEAPACGCDGANGECPGESRCVAFGKGECLCEPETCDGCKRRNGCVCP